MHNSGENDEVINLKKKMGPIDEPEFKIGHVDNNPGHIGKVEATPLSDLEKTAMNSYDKVKVKFDKFVNLIATHAYQDIFDKHIDEDVIISTDLLTDLANAHEEKEDGKKVPVVFIVGILLGVVLTYILLKT